MDLDQVSTRAAELAASFGVQAPHVVAGDVPPWSSGKLVYSLQEREPVVTVGAGFDDLSPVERDGSLANAMVAGDLYYTGAFKTGFIFGLCSTVVSLLPAYVALRHEVSIWVILPAFAALFVFGYLLTFAMRSRRIVYRADHRVAEVMGRSFADSMIDRDTHARPLLPGFPWLFHTAFSPEESRRTRRLDTTFGPQQIAG